MRYKLIVLFAPVCLLGACALESKHPVPSVARVVVTPPAPASQADRLLAYLIHTRSRQIAAQPAERERMRRVFQSEGTDFNRVKLVLLLSASTTSLMSADASDYAELLALLEPLIPRKVALPAKISRIDAIEIRAEANPLRRDDSKGWEVRALRAHVDELERKLAALKSIDRSVNRRSDTQHSEPKREDASK